MTTETLTAETNPADITDDLNAVEAEMNGTTPAEVETPQEAPEQPEEPRIDADGNVLEATGDEEEAPAEPKKGRTTADRIKALDRDRQHYKRQAEALEARLAALETPKPLTPAPVADNVSASSAPDPEKYQYGELDPQFIRDTAKFEAKALIEAYKTETRRESEEFQQRSAAERETAQLREKADSIGQAGAAKFSDFREVVVAAAERGEYELTKEMFELATETSVAPDILYHLASNPEEASRVARLAPMQQALWFARQEAQLATPAPAAPRKITQAGAPPASIPKGSGSGGSVRMDDLDDPRALDAIERALFGRK